MTTGQTSVEAANGTRPEGEALVEQVRDRYGKIATGTIKGCCGSGEAEEAVACQIGYGKDALARVPEGANLGLGCGAPIDFLALKPGERVLDLGSGGGLDVFLAADKVGPTGHVIGVDMTPAMLERARANAKKAGLANVEFREGRLEDLPLADATIDAVTSNCVINLVPDKGVVFREIARVLKPGGRLVVSDIILDGELPEALRNDLLAYVGCVSGAMQRKQYFGLLEAAGLTKVETLKDVDYLATVAGTLPEEAQTLLDRSGVKPEELAGKVHSVTYRASKPEAASCCGPSCCG
jgi:SAM-dependent methyltransferase